MRSHLHLFINRVAFICNILFLYCWLVRHTKDFLGNQDINSIIILLGWGASFFMNILLHGLWLYLMYKKEKAMVPFWLKVSNSLFFAVQIMVLLF